MENVPVFKVSRESVKLDLGKRLLDLGKARADFGIFRAFWENPAKILCT